MLLIGTVVLLIVLGILYYLQKTYVSFNKRVFAGLALGLILGVLSQLLLNTETITKIVDVYNIVGVGYVRFLQMVIYPIIIIATLRAMTKIGENNKVFSSLSTIIIVLLITTVLAASVAIAVSIGFDLHFDLLANVAVDQSAISSIAARGNVLEKPLYVFITDFITTNPFADLTGSRGNSIASLVIFTIIVGIAYLGVKRKEEAIADKFANAVEVLYKIIMRMVVLVLRLTPYGVFALIYKVAATSKANDIIDLFRFIGVSYLAMFIMFIVHSIILMFFGYNISTFYKKVFSLLTFAFVSRSSAASIPMNIHTQTKQLGVSEAVATSGASFGAILGQNACAGIYPAMLAIAVAPTVGIDIFSLHFLLTLLGVIAISSFGIAGVGGGATFAAIAVLSSFGMPLTIVALLISVEPIIDMARTALNINGSLVASLVSAKVNKEVDMTVYNDLNTINNGNKTS